MLSKSTDAIEQNLPQFKRHKAQQRSIVKFWRDFLVVWCNREWREKLKTYKIYYFSSRIRAPSKWNVKLIRVVELEKFLWYFVNTFWESWLCVFAACEFATWNMSRLWVAEKKTSCGYGNEKNRKKMWVKSISSGCRCFFIGHFSCLFLVAARELGQNFLPGGSKSSFMFFQRQHVVVNYKQRAKLTNDLRILKL